MKALVYTGPKSVEMREVPNPTPAAGEVLLRVESVGLCGSDIHAYLGHDERRPAPLILGHEAAGTIVEGPGTGNRVTVNPLVTCGTCEACIAGRDNLCPDRQIISMPPREGAFAELLAMPSQNLVVVPDHVSMDKAALTEPLACGWHAVRVARRTLEKPLAQATCLVLGGGAIGFGAALSLIAQGATSVAVAETNLIRHPALKNAGFDVFDPTTRDAPMADLIVDAVGFEGTRAEASKRANPGGVIVHIGLGSATGGLDIRRMTLQEIAFIGTYTYTADDFRATADAIFSGAMGPLDWPEVRALSDGAQAFSDSVSGKLSAPKVVFHP
ncbi:MAG: zinc-dependent alcohol dehydrogenase [Pikeienuella sp.]